LNTTSRTRADTRHNLILSALHLFSEQGIDAVSMRTINSDAGARNASAVHYHFGSKLGIIEAVIEFIREELDNFRLPALAELEARVDAGDPPTCREVMWAAFQPYRQLSASPGHGHAAIRFLAALQSHMNDDISEALKRDPQETAHRFDALLARALPQLSPEVRRSRYAYAWTLMVQGFAGTGSWERAPFGYLRAPSGDVALLRFFDFLVGGLEAPVTHP
jgi:AcrR family transcriptional regulator